MVTLPRKGKIVLRRILGEAGEEAIRFFGDWEMADIDEERF
jgi:hypothetical protein